MAGYLDGYGVVEARRERLLKRIAIWGLATLVTATVAFFVFRNWREERVVNRFLTLLKQQNYQEAYRMWGCTPETPCEFYPPEKFTEDWGPAFWNLRTRPAWYLNSEKLACTWSNKKRFP